MQDDTTEMCLGDTVLGDKTWTGLNRDMRKRRVVVMNVMTAVSFIATGKLLSI
jgi:hypothetical protein